MDTLQNSQNDAVQGTLWRLNLDFAQKGNQHFYIWRHLHNPGAEGNTYTLLIDLNNVYVPEEEIKRLVLNIIVPIDSIRCIAILNCNKNNRRALRLKLKNHNVKLFSHTAFFDDIRRAKEWLASQHAKC